MVNMKKRLSKAQKGLAKITKKIPKPKLPSRTVTKGRKGKFYDTESYAKEGLKQAMDKRNVIASGDLKKIQKFLKNPNITKQDQIDFFKQALENNPKMKLYKRYQRGGFTPPPPGVIMPEERQRRDDKIRQDAMRAEQMGYRQALDFDTEKKERMKGIRPTLGVSRNILNSELDRVKRNIPPYRSGGNVYSAKQFRRSRKH